MGKENRQHQSTELDRPPIPPSQEVLRGILDQIKTIYTNPHLAFAGHFTKSWKISYNGPLGRYNALTVLTPNSNVEKSTRIRLNREKGFKYEELHFMLEQDASEMLQIHQERRGVEQNRRVMDRLLELSADVQDVERAIEESNEMLKDKRRWGRASGQSFVNSEEAQELLKILSGKKVLYNSKGIFIGQRFIGIK